MSLYVYGRASTKLSTTLFPRNLRIFRNRSSTFSSFSGRKNNSPPPRTAIPIYVWAISGCTTITLGYVYYSGLNYAPLTHRRRWIGSRPQFEEQLGNQEYRNLTKQLQKDILPPNHRASQTLTRVGRRLVRASREFAREHDLDVCEQPFTFTVVRSETANAFVLPGNHVFVMTGLFKYVRDEDDLAAVIGHEIAHSLARHAGERISGSVVTNVLAAASFLVDPSGTLARVFLPAASVLRDLPNSRQQETEADQIGIHLAASACYDPRAAQRVFAAMKEDGGGNSAPEFLSTHPSHDSRLQDLESFLPAAMHKLDAKHDECRQVRRDMKAARIASAQTAGAVAVNGRFQS